MHPLDDAVALDWLRNTPDGRTDLPAAVLAAGVWDRTDSVPAGG
jgi:hypothetical protein